MATASSAVMGVNPMEIDMANAALRSEAGQKPDLNLDPFADDSGLTAEELAEISMDPEAEGNEEDDDDD
jgi:hypothetical protein